jgi:hypothetical protein
LKKKLRNGIEAAAAAAMKHRKEGGKRRRAWVRGRKEIPKMRKSSSQAIGNERRCADSNLILRIGYTTRTSISLSWTGLDGWMCARMDGWIDMDGIKMDGSCTILAHLDGIQD